MTILKVQQLSKEYKLYSNKLRYLIKVLTMGLVNSCEVKKVFQNIDFEVAHGEALGILGSNGAGKSTLLKTILGVVEPSSGHVKIGGTMTGLIELGLGLHPEFTGRENIFIVGQLYGFDNATIKKSVDGIIAFSELQDSIDRPVKYYSSGMQMRLAFSISTEIRPDLLIIDEALSVGDVYFQAKCQARIEDYKKQGTSFLIVSHDHSMIMNLCDRAILLEHGNIVCAGKPDKVIDEYSARNRSHSAKLLYGKSPKSTFFKNSAIKSIKLVNQIGQQVDQIAVGDFVSLEIQILLNQKDQNLKLGFMIRDRLGIPVFGTNSLQHNIFIKPGNSTSNEINCVIQFQALFGEGIYTISVGLEDAHQMLTLDWFDRAIVFNVLNLDYPKFMGSSYIPVKFHIQ